MAGEVASQEDPLLKESPLWQRSKEEYVWPRDTTEDDANYILHGRIIDLPSSNTKVVRIFLSSTFTGEQFFVQDLPDCLLHAR